MNGSEMAESILKKFVVNDGTWTDLDDRSDSNVMASELWIDGYIPISNEETAWLKEKAAEWGVIDKLVKKESKT
jgi:hypothetical protein